MPLQKSSKWIKQQNDKGSTRLERLGAPFIILNPPYYGGDIASEVINIDQSTTSGLFDMMVLTKEPNLSGCKKEHGKSVE